MKKLHLLFLSILLIPSLSFAGDRDDLFARIHDVSEPLAISIGPMQFNTQALRLLDDIATNTAGGGGGGATSNIVGINGVAPAVNNGVVSTGTLRVTIASNSTGQVALAAGAAAIGSVTVSNFPVTQPVSGTVAATQSGTWTVQPGNTANTTAWKVDGSAVTQPVSGTVTANAGTNLNTSALTLDATAAKLNITPGAALGANTGPLGQGSVTTAAPTYTTGQISPLSLTTAGGLRVDNSGNTQPVSGTITANAGTNLNTSALALDATAAKLTIAQGAAIASVTGPLSQTSTTTAAPTYVTATVNPLSTDTNGNLRTVDRSVVAQGTALGTIQGSMVQGSVTTAAPSYTTGNINPASLTTAGSLRVDINSVAGTTAVNGSGTATGALRVEIANNGTGTLTSVGSITTAITPGGAAANLGKAEDAVAASGDTGVAFLVKRLDAPVANAGTSGDADYAHPVSDNFGRLWVATVQTPVIDVGLTQFRLVSAATTNATVVKASQGNLYNIEVFNNGVAACYIKFYNTASAPTVGTTTTTKVLMVPAGGGLIVNSVNGIQFSAGIAFSITTNLVDTDTTAIAINQVAVNLDYK